MDDNDFEENGLLVTVVDLSGKKVTAGGEIFKLTSECQVLDASGDSIKVKALRDLDGKTITVIRDAAGSGYVTTIVIE